MWAESELRRLDDAGPRESHSAIPNAVIASVFRVEEAKWSAGKKEEMEKLWGWSVGFWRYRECD